MPVNLDEETKKIKSDGSDAGENTAQQLSQETENAARNRSVQNQAKRGCTGPH